MVHTFSAGQHLEPLAVLLQQLPAHRPVVCIPDALRQLQKLLPACGGIDGRGGHQLAQVIAVIFLGAADAGDDELQRPPVFGDAAPELDHAALVLAAEGAGVVPDLDVNHAAAVRHSPRQERLAAVGGLALRGLENVVAFQLVAGLHVGDPFIAFHSYAP